MKKKIILGALVLLAVICLANSMYVVEENDYACTVRFSRITSTTDTRACTSKCPSWTASNTSPRPLCSTTFPRPRCSPPTSRT